MPDLTMTRLEKLRGIIRRAGLDAAALVPGPYLFYLTGAQYHIASRPLVLFVPVEGDPAMLIGVLEMPRIEGKTTLPIRYFTYTDAEGYEGAFERVCKALNLAGQRVGVEGLKMRVLEGQLIQQYAPGCVIEQAEESFMWLRIHKDAQEVASMRRAIQISESALETTVQAVRAGMTERHILNMLKNALAQAGGGEDAFDPIVLSGPNSGQPHGDVTERPVSEGELLLFDFGTKIDGYLSDITRTFVVGEPNAKIRDIYDTVLKANLAAIAKAGPGVPAQEVDRAARKVITDSGFGEYFLHRTGHGLGIDIHEAPYIRDGNPMLLEPGMIHTIEPGIYIPEIGGVRIEDDVLITEQGVEVLTSYPKGLRSIGR
jgi:Xaa-Pro dipeptidase